MRLRLKVNSMSTSSSKINLNVAVSEKEEQSGFNCEVCDQQFSSTTELFDHTFTWEHRVKSDSKSPPAPPVVSTNITNTETTESKDIASGVQPPPTTHPPSAYQSHHRRQTSHPSSFLPFRHISHDFIPHYRPPPQPYYYGHYQHNISHSPQPNYYPNTSPNSQPPAFNHSLSREPLLGRASNHSTFNPPDTVHFLPPIPLFPTLKGPPNSVSSISNKHLRPPDRPIHSPSHHKLLETSSSRSTHLSVESLSCNSMSHLTKSKHRLGQHNRDPLSSRKASTSSVESSDSGHLSEHSVYHTPAGHFIAPKVSKTSQGSTTVSEKSNYASSTNYSVQSSTAGLSKNKDPAQTLDAKKHAQHGKYSSGKRADKSVGDDVSQKHHGSTHRSHDGSHKYRPSANKSHDSREHNPNKRSMSHDGNHGNKKPRYNPKSHDMFGHSSGQHNGKKMFQNAPKKKGFHPKEIIVPTTPTLLPPEKPWTFRKSQSQSPTVRAAPSQLLEPIESREPARECTSQERDIQTSNQQQQTCKQQQKGTKETICTDKITLPHTDPGPNFTESSGKVPPSERAKKVSLSGTPHTSDHLPSRKMPSVDGSCERNAHDSSGDSFHTAVASTSTFNMSLDSLSDGSFSDTFLDPDTSHASKINKCEVTVSWPSNSLQSTTTTSVVPSSVVNSKLDRSVQSSPQIPSTVLASVNTPKVVQSPTVSMQSQPSSITTTTNLSPSTNSITNRTSSSRTTMVSTPHSNKKMLEESASKVISTKGKPINVHSSSQKVTSPVNSSARQKCPSLQSTHEKANVLSNKGGKATNKVSVTESHIFRKLIDTAIANCVANKLVAVKNTSTPQQPNRLPDIPLVGPESSQSGSTQRPLSGVGTAPATPAVMQSPKSLMTVPNLVGVLTTAGIQILALPHSLFSSVVSNGQQNKQSTVTAAMKQSTASKPSAIAKSPVSTTASLRRKVTTVSLKGRVSTTASLRGPVSTTASLSGPVSTTASLRGSVTTTASLRRPVSTAVSLSGPVSSLRGSVTTTASLRGPVSTTASLSGPVSTTASLRGSVTTTASLRRPVSTAVSLKGPLSTTANLRGPISTMTSSKGPVTTTASLRGLISTTASQSSRLPAASVRTTVPIPANLSDPLSSSSSENIVLSATATSVLSTTTAIVECFVPLTGTASTIEGKLDEQLHGVKKTPSSLSGTVSAQYSTPEGSPSLRDGSCDFRVKDEPKDFHMSVGTPHFCQTQVSTPVTAAPITAAPSSPPLHPHPQSHIDRSPSSQPITRVCSSGTKTVLFGDLRHASQLFVDDDTTGISPNQDPLKQGLPHTGLKSRGSEMGLPHTVLGLSHTGVNGKQTGEHAKNTNNAEISPQGLSLTRKRTAENDERVPPTKKHRSDSTIQSSQQPGTSTDRRVGLARSTSILSPNFISEMDTLNKQEKEIQTDMVVLRTELNEVIANEEDSLAECEILRREREMDKTKCDELKAKIEQLQRDVDSTRASLSEKDKLIAKRERGLEETRDRKLQLVNKEQELGQSYQEILNKKQNLVLPSVRHTTALSSPRPSVKITQTTSSSTVTAAHVKVFSDLDSINTSAVTVTSSSLTSRTLESVSTSTPVNGQAHKLTVSDIGLSSISPTQFEQLSKSVTRANATCDLSMDPSSLLNVSTPMSTCEDASGGMEDNCLTYQSHEKSVSCIKVCGKYLFSCSSDCSVHVCDINTGELLINLPSYHKRSVTSLVVYEREDDLFFVTGSTDKYVNMHNVKKSKRVAVFNVGEQVMSMVNSGDLLFVGLKSGEVQVINLHTKKGYKNKQKCHQSCISHVYVYRNILYTSSFDCTVSLWDISLTLTEDIKHLKAVAVPKTPLCVKADDKHIFIACGNGNVYIYDANNWSRIHVLSNTNPKAIASLDLAGRVLVTSSFDKIVRCYDIETFELLQCYAGYEDRIFCVCVAKGKILAGLENGSLIVRNLDLTKFHVCKWKECGLRFAILDDLSRYHVKDHVSPDLKLPTTCKWGSCSKTLNPSELLGHLKKHCQETHH